MFHVEHSTLNKNRQGLYIHVPFCKSKCSYCDFFRIVDLSLVPPYVEALKKEIKFYGNIIKNPLSTIYIGGGTPSVLSYSILDDLLSYIHYNFDCSSFEEFTFECNPEDLDENLIYILKNYGVNRISLGVQSLNDSMLRFINRRHNSSKVYSSIDLLHNNGFDNISVDLIFGLPVVDGFSFKEDVDRFLSLDVKHLSAYSLTYEEGSWLTRLVNQGKVKPLDDDIIADQYSYLTDALNKLGFNHYEVSNYCKGDFYSRHNSDCWKRVPYLGIGPGAYSFDGKCRWNDISDVNKYICVFNDENIINSLDFSNDIPFIENVENITPKDIYNEVVMLGLRTSKGVFYNDIPANYISSFNTFSSKMINDGLLKINEDKLGYKYYYIPEDKWFLLDMITENMMI